MEFRRFEFCAELDEDVYDKEVDGDPIPVELLFNCDKYGSIVYIIDCCCGAGNLEWDCKFRSLGVR